MTPASVTSAAGKWNARPAAPAVVLLCPRAAAFAAIAARRWKARRRSRRPRAHAALTYALLLLGFALCLIYVVDAGYNPFLYFRF